MDARIFEGVIRDSSVAVTVLDGEKPGVPVIYANDAYLHQSDRSIYDIIGKPPFDVERFDDNRAAMAKLQESVREDRPCSVVVRAPRPGGNVGWNEVEVYPLNDAGGAHLFAAIHRDVSKHVETEQRLRTTNKALLRLAIHDGLTGIYNRQFFDQMLRREWRIQARAQGRLAILMIDIDDFKQFNDRCGHNAGDECLRAVAATLDKTLRRGSDFVARFGGDEFVALLTGASLRQAADVAEMICRRVQRIDLPGSDDKPADPGVPPRVAVTVGVAATRPSPDTGAETLLANADEALYRAKLDGKNRVAIASDEDQPGGAVSPRAAARRAGD